jgi:hypothetical protein
VCARNERSATQPTLASEGRVRAGRRATRLPVETLQAAARFVQHVSGYRVLATDELLAAGDDWTERLRAAVE